MKIFRDMLILLLILLFSKLVFPQQIIENNEDKLTYVKLFSKEYTMHDRNFKSADSLSFYQRRSEWRQIIDEFWGAGDPLEQKQQIFNTYADYIQNKYPCFNGLNLDWDSLRTHYYSQIDDSISKGRFSALMRNLTIPLKEFHIWAWDNDIEKTPLNPGTPIYILGNGIDVSHFGASLCTLPDSSLLVVNVIPHHPLDLQPGDIVLGYEGIPWKELTFELLNSDIPKIGQLAAAESAIINKLLINAGMNWHLFKSIDILKYSNGDTLHLSTDTLLTLNTSEPIYNSPQVPISGIPLPDFSIYNLSGAVSYGIYPGTNIGYIYLAKHWYEEVDQEFGEAVTALMSTDGLIIDLRSNQGGFQHIYSGLSQLFNFNTHTLSSLARCSNSDLFTLCPVEGPVRFNLVNDPVTFYDRPIAVLCGPNTASFGDIDVNTFKFHPMTHFFGKSSNGAMSGISSLTINGWNVFCAQHTLVNYYHPDKLLVRKEFPVDVDVWLEKDDVAKGEDTVVKRALEWIHNLSYAHDVTVNKSYVALDSDSILISAGIENPNNHLLLAMAYISNDSAVVDSVYMMKNNVAGDSIWKASWLPENEDIFHVAVKTEDPIDSTSWTISNATRFTTIGPLMISSYDIVSQDTIPNPGDRLYFRLNIQNKSNSKSAENISIKLTKLDTLTKINTTGSINYYTLLPGEIKESSINPRFDFNKNCPGNIYTHIKIDIFSGAFKFWSDTISIFIAEPVGIANKKDIPIDFSLNQNYPNPFNPSTIISYTVGANGHSPLQHVDLSIYNILGQKVTTLVNKKQAAGLYKVEWDASGFASGIYLCRLHAGNHVQTKKMIFMK